MDESEGRANEGLLRELVEGLMSLARDPPKRVGGVGDGFLDGELLSFFGGGGG